LHSSLLSQLDQIIPEEVVTTLTVDLTVEVMSFFKMLAVVARCIRAKVVMMPLLFQAASEDQVEASAVAK
jgi:hypothetical protein